MDIFIQQHYVCLTLRSWRHHNVQCLSHLNLMLFSPPPPTALRGLNSRQINLRTCVPGPPFKKKKKNYQNSGYSERSFLPAICFVNQAYSTLEAVTLNFEKQQINPYFKDPEQRTLSFWMALKARQKKGWQKDALISTCLRNIFWRAPIQRLEL